MRIWFHRDRFFTSGTMRLRTERLCQRSVADEDNELVDVWTYDIPTFDRKHAQSILDVDLLSLCGATICTVCVPSMALSQHNCRFTRRFVKTSQHMSAENLSSDKTRFPAGQTCFVELQAQTRSSLQAFSLSHWHIFECLTGGKGQYRLFAKQIRDNHTQRMSRWIALVHLAENILESHGVVQLCDTVAAWFSLTLHQTAANETACAQRWKHRNSRHIRRTHNQPDHICRKQHVWAREIVVVISKLSIAVIYKQVWRPNCFIYFPAVVCVAASLNVKCLTLQSRYWIYGGQVQ